MNTVYKPVKTQIYLDLNMHHSKLDFIVTVAVTSKIKELIRNIFIVFQKLEYYTSTLHCKLQFAILK